MYVWLPIVMISFQIVASNITLSITWSTENILVAVQETRVDHSEELKFQITGNTNEQKFSRRFDVTRYRK